MALKLTILSEHSVPLGARGSIVFGVGGGSIGRAHDNDWVLPDPQRYLSAHHARVKFRNGAFYLLDSSTNGVFVNERAEPLGRRASHPLRDGDRLQLGDYLIAVSIDGDSAEAPEASAVFPVNPATAHGEPGVGRGDLATDFSMRDLLRPDAEDTSNLGPLDGFGQPVLTADPGLLAFDQSDRERAASRPPPNAARAESRASENAAGIEAFCRGAGIDAKPFSEEAQARILHLAGLLLREALVGLKGLALAQREMRDLNQIDVGREDPQQIGLTGLPVEDLLLRLLQGHDAHRVDAVQWLRETLVSTRRHDLAFSRALRAALAEFLSRLDPKALAPGATQRAAGEVDAAALSERFRSITEMPSGKLPHLFIEVFARVFAAEYKSSGTS
ncbi:MAG TPA: type VI secretion system-associated FHA domain protein TagH [Steroidobacteraceae bacterium]|jgi:type VI secretion system protein